MNDIYKVLLRNILLGLLKGESKSWRVCEELAYHCDISLNEAFEMLKPLFKAMPWAHRSGINNGNPFHHKYRNCHRKQGAPCPSWPTVDLRMTFCQFILTELDHDRIVFRNGRYQLKHSTLARILGIKNYLSPGEWYLKHHPVLLLEVLGPVDTIKLHR